MVEGHFWFSTDFKVGLLHQALLKSNGAKRENNIGLLIHFNHNVDVTRDKE